MAVVRYDFGGLVFRTTYDFSRLERNICKVAGLYPGQPRILTILKENEGVTLSELSPLCTIGMPSLSVSVRNLQKAGYIRKEGSGKNQHLFLTEEGWEKAQIFHEHIDAFYRDLLADLGEEHSDLLNESMIRFDDYMKRYNETFEADHGWNNK